MENNENTELVSFRFSLDEQIEYFKNLKKQLIKLLYIIEAEQRGEEGAEMWFYGLMFDLTSANSLCDNKLTKVIVKIYGLYENNNYKTMTHAQIKRQIMEARGILNGLLAELTPDAPTAVLDQES